MDIATRPSEPAENPKSADAAPPPLAHPVILREDYVPPAWLVPEVALDFALGLEATRITARLSVRRNPAADGATTLRLNGDQIEPLAVRVDGQAVNDWRLDGADLLIDLPGEAHEIAIETEVNPAANSQLMGLYASGGMLCTQCEAEGFRRITFFPDRPDVLSTYRVQMRGDKASFPILLSNGNCEAKGEEADGTHWAEWHDPWPKPAYLFALVAGDLVANHDEFTTMSGRKVELNIWVREGDEARTAHAMQALKNSFKWDEEAFGREYDLDLFNVVAVSDFNMGAMESKGLNVFNTRYVLADRDRCRLRRHRRRDRARVLPQLVRQPRDLPRLVPAQPQGRLHGAARPAVQRRHGQRSGAPDRGRAGAALGSVPRGLRPARPPGAA
jgi:aminopeptidase N